MFRIIISIFFIAAGTFIFFGETKGMYGEIKIKTEESAVLDNALVVSRQVKSARDNLLAQYNQISQIDIDRLNIMLPAQPESVKIILQIDNMLRRKGMVLKSIDIKNQEKSSEDKVAAVAAGVNSDMFSTLPLTISVSGTYGAFYSFVKDVEQSLRLMDIKKVNFSVSDSDVYNFNIEAAAYWKKSSQ
ncbi:TPA: hypothetical protein DEW47_01925 [Patescibacteria group bacterium]|nr:MAG: hypothetical protein UT71_C0002G0063 [Parcubacteria group bacterium GW2011_GWF2_40_10]KKR47840.1 MAG: hypothetical protein UT83_C0003G0053 [Parcubacteria group bacterium GW2011_GWA2_40_143]KKR60271.1 MAG: hypothetical protein UT97_C0003G0053 [Parcubacteria group bacterium GW2011_GWC2_40_31]KKR75234.1 MAG: hypothetical protein UU18_C0010G0010 [Parcubacteria group bacterium GW2011_GWB2_40_8]KKR77441.1 MAG: hypothetical protein UU20_C0007G0011 [Parcubacteria group bacterium GW2011_GWE2_40_